MVVAVAPAAQLRQPLLVAAVLAFQASAGMLPALHRALLARMAVLPHLPQCRQIWAAVLEMALPL